METWKKQIIIRKPKIICVLIKDVHVIVLVHNVSPNVARCQICEGFPYACL